MSRSIISGLVGSGYPADHIIASNPSTPKLDALKQDFGILTTQDNAEAIAQSDVIVLAVKPQLMESVCQAFPQDPSMNNKVFVSIAAGIPVARLQAMLGGEYAVIRTMPNTPSALGKGLTGLYATPDITEPTRQFASDLMSAVGEVVWVEQESGIDGVIAAAGSSPAYFFLFLEAMQEKAEALGFDHDTARVMVQQAMLGAAEMVCHNPQLELSELRAQVTSKGGTTAEAIASLQASGLNDIVAKAMQAAVDRADEMSKQF